MNVEHLPSNIGSICELLRYYERVENGANVHLHIGYMVVPLQVRIILVVPVTASRNTPVVIERTKEKLSITYCDSVMISL